MKKSESIVTRDFILLFLFSVAICTGMNMLNVTVPLYVTGTLGGTERTAGWMTTIYTVAACASRPVNGVLTDRIGRRKLMALGSLLFCAACLTGVLIPSLLMLGFCRLLMGIGYSAASTANNTASTDIIPASRLSEGIGYFGMSQSVASAVGPALGSVAIALVGNRSSLLVSGGAAALALLLSIPIRYETSPAYHRPARQDKQRGGFFERTAILPSLFQGMSLFLISCLMCFMTLYIVSRGFPSTIAGSFFAVASVVIIAVRLLFSRWMNHRPAVYFLIPGYLLLIAVCVLLPQVNSAAGFLCAGALYGAAHGTIWMTLGSAAVNQAPPERRGAANATFYFAFDAAIGLGAAFWGEMIVRLEYNRCFVIIIVAAAVLAAASIPAFRKRGSISSDPV